jgi:hypothetical protein
MKNRIGRCCRTIDFRVRLGGPTKVYLATILTLCLPVQSVADLNVAGGYKCTISSSTEKREILEYLYEPVCGNNLSPPSGVEACRVDYVKNGSTKVLWRAYNDYGYCFPRAEAFANELRELGWTCDGFDGYSPCFDFSNTGEEEP